MDFFFLFDLFIRTFLINETTILENKDKYKIKFNKRNVQTFFQLVKKYIPTEPVHCYLVFLNESFRRHQKRGTIDVN